MKYLSIIGSTGSIGTQTLSVVRECKDLKVCALSAGSNIELLEKQMREFKPELVSVSTDELANELKNRTKDLSIPIHYGNEGLIDVACFKKADTVVTAIVGMVGIVPTIEAIKAGKDIALANKETLVCAGHIIMPLAKKQNVSILPVDSEHSAIFQCLNGEKEHDNEIDKILLTASGGPFRGKKISDLKGVTAKDALKHPSWSMGKKVTIDSSTLVNKGLEVMEARWLFDVSVDKIQVVIHPQSVIHSMVQYVDGAVIAQLGVPDMRLPIQYALTYPARKPLSGDRLDFSTLKHLDFEEPDLDTFKGLKFAVESLKKGGNMPTILNAANENAVALFLKDKIEFLDIADIIEDCMNNIKFAENPDVLAILDTRNEVDEYMKGRYPAW